MLSSRILATGYSKKDDMTKSVFIRKEQQAVVNSQNAVIERAFDGQSL